MAGRAEAERIVAELDRSSGGRLCRREDLTALLELGLPVAHRGTLDELAFSAKFLARARDMMARIGPGGQGYDRLAAEFVQHLERVTALLRTLLAGAPEGVRTRFASAYFATTPEALENLLELCHDLGWYKNRLIDRGRG